MEGEGVNKVIKNHLLPLSAMSVVTSALLLPAKKEMTLFSCSLLAGVSYDEAKWNKRRETSAGFQQYVWWSRRPNFWSKLTGFQNRFRLMCNTDTLLDCTLTIIEPMVDYGFHEICEFRNFSVIKSSAIKPNKFHSKYVCFAGQKACKEWKICLKIRLFGFLQRLVMGSTTTAACKVISSLTLIGPFKII